MTELEPSAPAWVRPKPFPLDLCGPLQEPYQALAPDFHERGVYDLFEAVANLNPAAMALSDGIQIFSYADVRRKVSQLSAEIVKLTPAGGAVAVLLSNQPEAIIAVLACLAAGRCCLILNADHPADRNTSILASAGAEIVIIKGHDSPAALSLAKSVIRISIQDAESREVDVSNWRSSVGPDEPAIVIYTSGSTGQPKGIVISQRIVLSWLRRTIEAAHLNETDHVLSLGAIGTIAGLVYSLGTLLSGGLQFVLSVSSASVSGLLKLIREEHISVLSGVPALLRLLFEVDRAADSLKSLRIVRTFGERLCRCDLDAWRKVLPTSCHFGVTYGQTEVSISGWFVPPEYNGNEAIVPVGYLSAEHEFAVVDQCGRTVPEQEIGELVIRSRFVALGEWENGRCVSGRMRPDQVDPGRRILATGDLVRLRPDGIVEVVGRADRQVKIRGQRVELAEIESTFRRVPGVADAAVVVRRTGEDASLIAFIVPRDKNHVSLAETARAIVRRTLPNYMQPSRILLTSKCPLLPGGKLDEKTLLATEAATPPDKLPDQALPAPSLRARHAVAGAWVRVLDRASLDADVPFEAAGGDSLRLLRFVFYLEELCGTSLSLDPFYGDLRPSDFTQRLDRYLDGPVIEAEDSSPIFLLPGMAGDGITLARLRAACAPSLRFVTLDYGNWPERVSRDFDCKALIVKLMDNIRSHAPDGPLFLAGYSLGGHLAFALASAFSAAGRHVSFLGLLDSDMSQYSIRKKSRPFTKKLEILAHERQRGSPWADLLAMIVSRNLARPYCTPILRLAVRFWRVPLPGGLEFYLNRRLIGYLNMRLVAHWYANMARPMSPLQVPTFLFRSEHDATAAEDLGWREFCSNLSIVSVRGGHHTMLERANVNILAERFINCVQLARGNVVAGREFALLKAVGH